MMRTLEFTQIFYRKRKRQATFCLTKTAFKALLVESIIAPQLKQSFGSDVFYWKPDHEVGFLVFRESKLHQLIEGKYQEKIRPEDSRHLKKAGRGILLSKSDFKIQEGNILVIPAHMFLASL